MDRNVLETSNKSVIARDWKGFLHGDENKEELFSFLYQETVWKLQVSKLQSSIS